MGVSPDTLTALINGGVLGLSALFGNHSNATNAAAMPLAMLKSQVGAAAPNLDMIKGNATMIANLYMQSNPMAAQTAIAIASNPAALGTLLPTLEAEILQQSGDILTSLAHAVATTGQSITFNPGVAPSISLG